MNWFHYGIHGQRGWSVVGAISPSLKDAVKRLAAPNSVFDGLPLEAWAAGVEDLGAPGLLFVWLRPGQQELWGLVINRPDYRGDPFVFLDKLSKFELPPDLEPPLLPWQTTAPPPLPPADLPVRSPALPAALLAAVRPLWPRDAGPLIPDFTAVSAAIADKYPDTPLIFDAAANIPRLETVSDEPITIKSINYLLTQIQAELGEALRAQKSEPDPGLIHARLAEAFDQRIARLEHEVQAAITRVGTRVDALATAAAAPNSDPVPAALAELIQQMSALREQFANQQTANDLIARLQTDVGQVLRAQKSEPDPGLVHAKLTEAFDQRIALLEREVQAAITRVGTQVDALATAAAAPNSDPVPAALAELIQQMSALRDQFASQQPASAIADLRADLDRAVATRVTALQQEWQAPVKRISAQLESLAVMIKAQTDQSWAAAAQMAQQDSRMKRPDWILRGAVFGLCILLVFFGTSIISSPKQSHQSIEKIWKQNADFKTQLETIHKNTGPLKDEIQQLGQKLSEELSNTGKSLEGQIGNVRTDIDTLSKQLSSQGLSADQAAQRDRTRANPASRGSTRPASNTPTGDPTSQQGRGR